VLYRMELVFRLQGLDSGSFDSCCEKLCLGKVAFNMSDEDLLNVLYHTQVMLVRQIIIYSLNTALAILLISNGLEICQAMHKMTIFDIRQLIMLKWRRILAKQ